MIFWRAGRILPRHRRPGHSLWRTFIAPQPATPFLVYCNMAQVHVPWRGEVGNQKAPLFPPVLLAAALSVVESSSGRRVSFAEDASLVASLNAVPSALVCRRGGGRKRGLPPRGAALGK